jgi:hypothetical protein
LRQAFVNPYAASANNPLTMSNYLLLRNNQESGPFTLEEIKGMSLKSYDLLWVVGKSAAWRYPGEIAEFKLFAPPVPEQISDDQVKRRNTGGHAVYVNLPAEKKQLTLLPDRVLFDEDYSSSPLKDTTYDVNDMYKSQPSRSIRFSGKLLWAGTVILLFGAGIITGLFISDRGKFFSTDANHPQNSGSFQSSLNGKNTVSQKIHQIIGNNIQNAQQSEKTDSVKVMNSVPRKIANRAGKKSLNNNTGKKDSLFNPDAARAYLRLNDSLKQEATNKTEILYQKIKSHPENYVNLETGRYSTSIFGGISSFPVTVTNSSPVIMDLVVVNIDYIQKNEKVFKTESLSFNNLEPGETVTIQAPKSSRGTKIVTRIHVVNSSQLNLSYSN